MRSVVKSPSALHLEAHDVAGAARERRDEHLHDALAKAMRGRHHISPVAEALALRLQSAPRSWW
jgi:hypothetical protein